MNTKLVEEVQKASFTETGEEGVDTHLYQKAVKMTERVGRSKKVKQGRKTSYGEGHFLLRALLDHSQTREEIWKTYRRFANVLGIAGPPPGSKKYQKLQQKVDTDLARLVKLELVVADEDKLYRLTEAGIREATRVGEGLEKFTNSIGTFFAKGENAAKLSVVIDLLLSILKLGVGFLSNSMALTADGFDNMVDVASAAVVFLGIKYKKELISTAFVLLVMFATAGWIGYQAVLRLIHPEVVDAGVMTIVAAIVSGLVCYLMSVYQYAVGKNTYSLSLISQSIDSKNHVFTAVAVLIGVIFARFNIFIVDSIVALGVAIMILKSAIELAVETLRIAKGAALDISRFARIEEKIVENHRKNYLKGWILFLLQETNRKEEIVTRCADSFSTEGIPFVDQFGFLKGYDFVKSIDPLLKELVDKGFAVNKAESYYLTGEGEKALRRIPVSERFV
jgi:cation diffusion facilitator family transporter